MLDSIVKTVKNYYPQVFLEECKYVIKEKKINKYIIDGVEISSDSHEETLLEKIQIEKKIWLWRKLWCGKSVKIQMEKNSGEKNYIKENFFYTYIYIYIYIYIYVYIYKNGK